MELTIKYIPTNEIKPYDNNPRKNDEAVRYVAESIKEFGFKNPVILSKDNVIIAGHTRMKAAEELGIEEVPCIYAEDLTEEQAKAFRLADNKVAEIASWDFGKLEEELANIDIDMSEFGFDVKMQDDQTEIIEDYAPEQAEPKCKLGDLWQLGDHRLICGDSTDSAVIDRLMDGAKAKILFTSPPYSDMRDYNGGKDLSVENLSSFIPAYRPYTDYQCVNLGIQRKDNDVYEYWNEYIKKARQCGYKLLAWNVWDKGMTGHIGQARAFFPLRHEFIFVFGTQFFEINLTHEKKEKSITDNPSKRTKRNKDGTTSYNTTGDTSKKYKQMESVLYMHPVLDNKTRDLHPAQFPVGLPSEYIKSMTDECDSVIEPFGGAGTTMIACEQLNRKCYMCELDERYCDVIIERWENFTGQKAIKL